MFSETLMLFCVTCGYISNVQNRNLDKCHLLLRNMLQAYRLSEHNCRSRPVMARKHAMKHDARNGDEIWVVSPVIDIRPSAWKEVLNTFLDDFWVGDCISDIKRYQFQLIIRQTRDEYNWFFHFDDPHRRQKRQRKFSSDLKTMRKRKPNDENGTYTY